MFPLNAPQRRHLAVVLDHVDAALLRVVTSASGGAATQRLLRPEAQDIPATVAPRFLAEALALRAQLARDLVRLEIHRTPESARRRAAAYLTSALVLLEDCHASAMAAYGDIDAALPSQLDPWLAELEVGVAALRRLLDEEATDDTTD